MMSVDHTKQGENPKPFKDIRTQTWFTYERGIYVKKNDTNAVEMSTGHTRAFTEETVVNQVNVWIMLHDPRKKLRECADAVRIAEADEMELLRRERDMFREDTIEAIKQRDDAIAARQQIADESAALGGELTRELEAARGECKHMQNQRDDWKVRAEEARVYRSAAERQLAAKQAQVRAFADERAELTAQVERAHAAADHWQRAYNGVIKRRLSLRVGAQLAAARQTILAQDKRIAELEDALRGKQEIVDTARLSADPANSDVWVGSDVDIVDARVAAKLERVAELNAARKEAR